MRWMRAVSLMCLLVLAAAGCAPANVKRSGLNRFEYEQPEMGVPFRMVLYAADKATADAASKAAFARIEQLNQILSDYEEDSELSRLSRTAGQGRAVKVSPELWKVLRRSQELANESAGAFDITVGPFVNLWRRARREHKLPDSSKLEQARAAVGYRKLVLEPRNRTAQLLAPGMRLDLGGIGKGYAIDEALGVLSARGIHSALVSGGGDLVVSEPPPGKPGWRIELTALDGGNAKQFVSLRRAAISTSGDLFQRLEIGGKRYSHIVDPRTGLGLTDHSLVTVIAPDGITSDSLTKVASILGPEQALNFLEKKPGVSARLMSKPGERVEVFESSSFKRNIWDQVGHE